MFVDERLRTGKRVVLATAEGRTPAEELWRIGSIEGAEAVGFADTGGQVALDADAPELALVAEEQLLDAAVYSGSAAVLRAAP